MIFSSIDSLHAEAVKALFLATFFDSEGENAGTTNSKLAFDLAHAINNQDVFGFACTDNAELVAAIFFSRLSFAAPIDVFILSPVAVLTEKQGSGIGQRLIAFGLEEISKQGASYATTYGDPDFYSRIGFEPLSTMIIEPPYTLSQPEGWLGQSLNNEPLVSRLGRAQCVAALDDQVFW